METLLSKMEEEDDSGNPGLMIHIKERRKKRRKN